MLALSIRQPYAELILRGIKTIEYRSRRCRMLGERFWIYASKGTAALQEVKAETNRPDRRVEARHEALIQTAQRIWSDDLAVPGEKTGGPPQWLLELAEMLILDQLPRGLLVGSAVIERCCKLPADRSRSQPGYEWHLADVQRTPHPRPPARHPQPMWFNPF